MTLIGLMVIAGPALVVIGLTGLLLVGLEEEEEEPTAAAGNPSDPASGATSPFRGGIPSAPFGEIPNDQAERSEIT